MASLSMHFVLPKGDNTELSAFFLAEVFLVQPFINIFFRQDSIIMKDAGEGWETKQTNR